MRSNSISAFTENDTCKTVRLKARLAGNCMKNPEKFKWMGKITFEEMDVLCSMLDEKTQGFENLSIRTEE